SLKWVQTQLLLKNMTLQSHRRVNSWNAYLKAKISEVNEGREQGERVRLTEYVAEKKDELLEGYNKLTAVEQRAFIDKLQAARDAEMQIVRADPKAISNTVSAAFATMDREVHLLFTRECHANRPTLVDIPVYAPSTNCQRPLNKLVSECRTLIQDELDYVLTEKRVKQKVQMNYDNYERQIVEQYSIALTG
ncbi:hypothetical protein L210DRAFT_3331503, partial [Boletus edulis BED1]